MRSELAVLRHRRRSSRRRSDGGDRAPRPAADRQLVACASASALIAARSSACVIVLGALANHHSYSWCIGTYFHHRLFTYGLWADGAFAIGVGVLPVFATLAWLLDARCATPTSACCPRPLSARSSRSAVHRGEGVVPLDDLRDPRRGARPDLPRTGRLRGHRALGDRRPDALVPGAAVGRRRRVPARHDAVPQQRAPLLGRARARDPAVAEPQPFDFTTTDAHGCCSASSSDRSR